MSMDRIYETSYYHFVKSVAALEAYPFYANNKDRTSDLWHLKNDLLDNANILVNQPDTNLTVDQLKKVCVIITLVAGIPVDGNNERANREARLWGSIREQSELLLGLLEAETLRVHSILWPETN